MSIKDDVIKLYKSGAKRIVLSEIEQRRKLVQTVGVGLPSVLVSGGPGSAASIRTELFVVYSHLIITEDGAFERPHGWPLDGAYPPGTVAPTPLPPSLILAGGILSLDVSVQYYEQMRAHLVAFDADGALHEDHLFVKMAMPFEGDGYFQGVTSHVTGVFTPDLFMTGASGLSETANARKTELLATGITYVD